jgi:D-glycero-alpha-D-manno-heptose-7-phosphate kinase
VLQSRTPVRISFVGGGSDIPAFYRHRTGAVVSTAIDKYVYVRVRPVPGDRAITVRHSEQERVQDVAQLKHELVRECLRLAPPGGALDLTITADVPPSSGLGSSSALCVGVLHVLRVIRGEKVEAAHLAAEACTVEMDRCGAPIGRQDQYAAAFGGLNSLRFNPDDTVDVLPLACSAETLAGVQRRLMLFRIGARPPAATVLAGQVRNMRDEAAYAAVAASVELAAEFRASLEAGELARLGPILDRAWRLKRSLAPGISNSTIARAYASARSAGATGGKVLGAGGGGFLLLYCEPEHQAAVRAALAPMRELPFRFASRGSLVTELDG